MVYASIASLKDFHDLQVNRQLYIGSWIISVKQFIIFRVPFFCIIINRQYNISYKGNRLYSLALGSVSPFKQVRRFFSF